MQVQFQLSGAAAFARYLDQTRRKMPETLRDPASTSTSGYRRDYNLIGNAVAHPLTSSPTVA